MSTVFASPDCDPPEREPAPAARALPPRTCDTHFHVFGPQARYPLDPRRNYTPHECALADYRRVMRAVGIQRAVIVQPSVYGTDNRAMLDALREGGPAFRGVAVPPASASDDALLEMHRLGVRGIRLNLVNPAVLGLADALSISRRMAAFGWHLQVLLDVEKDAHTLCALGEMTAVPLVIDHMGKSPPSASRHELAAMLREGACWVKLSAPYRVSTQPSPHDDVIPLVHALAEANTQRLLWGSDWPHTELRRGTPAAASLAAMVSHWFPDDAVRRQVCAANPAGLYDYPLEMT